MRPEWRRLDCFEWQSIEIALKCEVDRRGRTPGPFPPYRSRRWRSILMACRGRQSSVSSAAC
jgi:hypothetical protein